MAIQSSSHNYPIEIRDPVFSISNSYACCALRDNSDTSGTEASNFGEMVFPLATVIIGQCTVFY